ncbi:PEGA domain-containing protein [Candidatus Daviesbacteria bacterium]|nr:PEGA domain-containing protein [Candidatus Daviesbacteria bacterium]
MKKTLFSILVLLSVIVLAIRFVQAPLVQKLGLEGKGGIKITSLPDGLNVLINGEEVGKTPYENNDLKPAEYQIKLTDGDATWQGKVQVNGGTQAIVNRELSASVASSSGEVFTLTKGQGVVVASTPTGAKVEIDGKDYGTTPLTIPDLAVGEHTFMLSHSNFLKRSIRASLPPKLSLNIVVDLAMGEIDLTTSAAFTTTNIPKVIVKQTPTGFLRVRDKPSVAGQEISQVSVGQTLILIEELSGWDKVKLDNGTEGYVSASYVEKQP